MGYISDVSVAIALVFGGGKEGKEYFSSLQDTYEGKIDG